MGQGGDLINLHINCPNIRDIPNNQIPLQKVGDYWGFDTRSITVQYTETVAVLKVVFRGNQMLDYRGSLLWSKPLCCPPSARTGVVGHNIDRCITKLAQFPGMRTNSWTRHVHLPSRILAINQGRSHLV